MSVQNINELYIKLKKLDDEIADKTITQAVLQGGLIVQAQARLLITSDSHALERSIKVRQEKKSDHVSATTYTNSHYSVFYEFGTGPTGQANHKGISPLVTPRYSQKGWMIPADAMSVEKAEGYGFRVARKNGEVIGYYTNGQMARPFMYPALKDNEKKIIKNTRQLLKNKMKEVCSK